MLSALLGLVLLLAVSALLWWWARGGVVPAIMLSAPAAFMLAVAAVGFHDTPTFGTLQMGAAWVGGLLAVAWAPRLVRRRAAPRFAIIVPPAAASRGENAERFARDARPGPLDDQDRMILRGAGLVGAVCVAVLTCYGVSR